MHARRKRLGKNMDAPRQLHQRKAPQQAMGGRKPGEVINGKRLDEYAGTNPYGHHLWYWICPACEQRQGPSTISHLNRNMRCSTCRRKREHNPRWSGYEQIARSFISRYQWEARKKGLIWELTDEQLWAKWLEQEGRCAYTGWNLAHGVDASIDRIDSRRGYVTGNFQWVHTDINRLKDHFPEARFLNLCRAVTEHAAASQTHHQSVTYARTRPS